MLFRRLLLLIIVLLSAGNASGQSVSVVDVSLTLLNWTKHLNNDVDKYFTKDKGAELTRNLDALRQDLTLYMKARKGIADSIFRHNISPGKKDPQNQELLKSRMGEVMRQMRNVTDLTNNELRAEGDRLNDQIYEVLNAEGATYLSYLEAFLNGLDVSKKNIALDGSVAYDRLQQSISQLTVTLDKISHKMK
jgi:hypothetical protein